jgi:CRISPR-associated protein Csm2
MMNMESFYSNEEKKIVKADLFDKTAQEIASGFIKKRPNGRDWYCVSGSQMRRHYDEVKRFDQNLDGTSGTWEKNYPYIKMIKSKVSYNVARVIDKKPSDAEVYKSLSTFILNYIDLVKNEDDYHVFTALFEAVYGFYYKETIEKNIRGRD